MPLLCVVVWWPAICIKFCICLHQLNSHCSYAFVLHSPDHWTGGRAVRRTAEKFKCVASEASCLHNSMGPSRPEKLGANGERELVRNPFGQRHTFGLPGTVNGNGIFEILWEGAAAAAVDFATDSSLAINVNYTIYIFHIMDRQTPEHLPSRCRYKDTTCLAGQEQLLLLGAQGTGDRGQRRFLANN